MHLQGYQKQTEWVLAYQERFESLSLPTGAIWQENHLEEADPYSGNGAYFYRIDPKFTPPKSFRISSPFGQDKMRPSTAHRSLTQRVLQITLCSATLM
jgi:hypothetical protein